MDEHQFWFLNTNESDCGIALVLDQRVLDPEMLYQLLQEVAQMGGYTGRMTAKKYSDSATRAVIEESLRSGEWPVHQVGRFHVRVRIEDYLGIYGIEVRREGEESLVMPHWMLGLSESFGGEDFDDFAILPYMAQRLGFGFLAGYVWVDDEAGAMDNVSSIEPVLTQVTMMRRNNWPTEAAVFWEKDAHRYILRADEVIRPTVVPGLMLMGSEKVTDFISNVWAERLPTLQQKPPDDLD